MENTFSPRLLPADEATIGPHQLTLGVRLPWYRSLPLSVTEIASLTVDGMPVPSDKIRLTLNDHTYSLDQVPEQVQESWFVLDSVRLDVDLKLDPDTEHRIDLVVHLYPPYIPGLTWVTGSSLTLAAAGRSH